MAFFGTMPVALGQPAAGLVAHWAFEEGSGVLVQDASPNGNHGTLINGASAWTTGRHGGGLRCDGTSRTEVRIPNSPSLSLFMGATYAAWVNSANPGRDAPILAKEGGSTRSFWFGAIGGQFGLLLSPNGTSWPTLEPSRRKGGVPANRWTHLAVTWDGATMRMYENGFLIGTHAYAMAVANTSAHVSIGVNSTFNNTQFQGVIDEVYVYNRALAAAEVVSLMGEATCAASFTDAFTPASPLWNNSIGNWTSVAGTYYALSPSNNPLTYSGLPFEMRNFEVSVRVNNFTDGGIWLRADGSNQNGILLVTGGNAYGLGNRTPPAGSRLYFHRVVNGAVSGQLASTGNIITPGSTHDLRVVASGSAYAVFVDGSETPATILVDETHSRGRTGFYSNQPNIPAGGSGPPQTFSNFFVADFGPVVDQHPTMTSTCPSRDASFSVVATGVGPLAYQWQIETAPGSWAPLGAAPLPLPCGGAAHATAPTTSMTNIGVVPCPGLVAYPVRAVVTNSCGSITSNPATLTICPADTDDGTGTGTCDGGVTIDDLLYYLRIFEEGLLAADVDDGTGSGTPDGGVTIDDLLYYLFRFESGC